MSFRVAAAPFRPAALIAALLGAVCLGCGGGTEVAAPDPIVASSGLASGSVDAVDLGGSQLVVSGIAKTNTTFPPVAGELVTIAADGTATLANAPVAPGLTTATDAVSGAPLRLSTSTCAGQDVRLDNATGVLTICPGGALAPGSMLRVSYLYAATVYDLQVGITFPAGNRADVRLYNILPTSTAPFTINLTAVSAPAGGVRAFGVAAETELTGVVGRKDYREVGACSTAGAPGCLTLNTLEVTQIDLSNQLDTCLSGRLMATVHDQEDPDPDSRAILLLDFSDPVCP